MDPQDEIAKVERLRLALGVPRAQVARVAGYDPSLFAIIALGQRNPSEAVLTAWRGAIFRLAAARLPRMEEDLALVRDLLA